jgi:hypothetical protein
LTGFGIERTRYIFERGWAKPTKRLKVTCVDGNRQASMLNGVRLSYALEVLDSGTKKR